MHTHTVLLFRQLKPVMCSRTRPWTRTWDSRTRRRTGTWNQEQNQGQKLGTKAKAKNSKPKPRTSKCRYYSDTLPSIVVTLTGFCTFYTPLVALAKYPHALRVGYFASKMNALRSLGGVVRSTWYAVVVTCRGRH